MIFTKTEEAKILGAIRAAERRTSGEIRIFVEDVCPREHPVERAAEIFHAHGMHNTRYRNAVLLYLAERSQNFAIWGDAGIHQQVGFQFWDEEKHLLREHFRDGKFTQGVVKAVRQIGERLAQYFPDLPGDTNELPDEIIYG